MMEWIDLKSETEQEIAWSCLKTKIIESAMAWAQASDPHQVRQHEAMLRGWTQLHSTLLTSTSPSDFPPLTADMAMVDLFSECAGVCQFCAALAVQFHPSYVDLSDLIPDGREHLA